MPRHARFRWQRAEEVAAQPIHQRTGIGPEMGLRAGHGCKMSAADGTTPVRHRPDSRRPCEQRIVDGVPNYWSIDQ